MVSFINNRFVILSEFCALLVCHSFAEVIEKTRNGIHYKMFQDNEVSLQVAKNSCPDGLLWFENQAEMDWFHSNFPRDEDIWLAASGGVKRWENGIPFSSELNAETGNSDECAIMDESSILWRQCDSEYYVVCKNPGSSCPQPSLSRYFRSIATDRRQTGSKLASTTELSVIACSVRCLRSNMCCAFDFKETSGWCRLLSNAREELWVFEERATIFGIES